MNRTNEFSALMTEPVDMPPRLEGAVQRAKQRHSRRLAAKVCAIPAASLAGLAAAFVLVVNLSLPAALAAGTVPVLKDLLSAVAFSDSLQMAVKNDYIQYSGQNQTQNGITVAIQYLIVDKRQVNVLYTMESAEGHYLQLMPTAVKEDGVTPADGYIGSWGGDPSAGLHSLTLEFLDGPVPSVLHLSCEVSAYESNSAQAPVELPPGQEEEPLLGKETFLFHLPLKEEYTATGETLSIGQWLELDGQRVYLDTIDVLPTYTQLNLVDDENNTAWLRDLHFYLEDGGDVRYELYSGATPTGSETPFRAFHRVESIYFSPEKQYRLVITGADWMNKDSQWLNGMEIGRTYVSGELPCSQTSLSLTRQGDGIEIFVHSPRIEGCSNNHSHLSWAYRSGEGSETRYFQSGGFSPGDEVLTEHYMLSHYPGETIDLGVDYTHHTALSTPITIDLPAFGGQ